MGLLKINDFATADGVKRMIEREAKEFVKRLDKVPASKEELEAVFIKFVKQLEDEGCFDPIALHDGRCECYQGAWTCGCYKRRFGE